MSEQSNAGSIVAPALPSPAAARTYSSSHNAQIMRWVPSDAATVLDVGCGAGGNAAYLARRGITVDGVTLSPAEARDAGQWCRQVLLHNLEYGLPDDARGPYDAVLCSHILEHICFPQRLLLDINRRLRRGGKLIAAVPNLLYFKNRIRLLCGRFEYAQGGIMDDTHFRWYTLPTLTKLLHNHDFVVEYAYGSGNVALGPLRRLLPAFCRQLDLAACHLVPGLFGWQLLVVATPK